MYSNVNALQTDSSLPTKITITYTCRNHKYATAILSDLLELASGALKDALKQIRDNWNSILHPDLFNAQRTV